MKIDIFKIFLNFFIFILFFCSCSKQNDEKIKNNNEYTLVTITNATKKIIISMKIIMEKLLII